jgi:hypothetical protein
MPDSRVTAGWFFWEFPSRSLPRLARREWDSYATGPVHPTSQDCGERDFPVGRFYWRGLPGLPRGVPVETCTIGEQDLRCGAEPKRKGTEPKIREKETETSEQKVSA